MLVLSRQYGAFTMRKWSDGVTQFCVTAHLEDGTPPPAKGHFYTLEKVERRRARYGGRWYLADRCLGGDSDYSTSIYAPKLAGPFGSLKEAKAVLLSFMAMKGILMEEA